MEGYRAVDSGRERGPGGGGKLRFRPLWVVVTVLLGIAVTWWVVHRGPGSSAKLSFNQTIQPILSENCYACHGPDPGSRKAELRLDRAEFAFAPRKEGGKIIVPGDPDHSPLVQRIESKDEKKMMPPPEAHKTLKPEETALLRRWVAEG